jgi:hypothetical protein
MFVCFSIHRFAKEGEMFDTNKTTIVVCKGLNKMSLNVSSSNPFWKLSDILDADETGMALSGVLHVWSCRGYCCRYDEPLQVKRHPA